MRIVCFTAHPDDETVFAGGSLALLARHGAEIHLLCATRGEGGEAGEPPVCVHEQLGNVRESELRCAAHALGCASVEFLPFRDPDVGADGSLSAYAADPQIVAPHLEGFLAMRKPDAILTHGTNGEYGHPAHVLTNRACLLAARAARISAIYTFSAFYPAHPRLRSANRDDPADLVVDISGAFEQKLAAMECYRSQRALFLRRPSAEAGHPVPLRDALLRRESFHLVRPFRKSTDGEMRRFLKESLLRFETGVA